MENVKNWLDKKGYYNSGLRTDRNHRIDLYLSDVLEEYKTELLNIHDVVKSLPIQDLPNCTRVEVIDQKGRSYVNWKPTNKVRLSMQDDGKTAKIFID